jgi:hypothetical protein
MAKSCFFLVDGGEGTLRKRFSKHPSKKWTSATRKNSSHVHRMSDVMATDPPTAGEGRS